MKKILGIMAIGIVLLSVEAFAGNGDLIVDGKLGVGTANPVSRLSLGDYISTGTLPTLYGSQIQVNDAPTLTTGDNTASLYLVNQPNISGHSSATNYGTYNLVTVPAITWNYNSIIGSNNMCQMNGSGTLAYQNGSAGFALNSSSGTVTTQIGAYGYAANVSSGTVVSSEAGGFTGANQAAGTITALKGLRSSARNNGTGLIGTAFGLSSDVKNNSTGTITTAYGIYSQIYNPSGTVVTGYGLYIDNVKATNKWSLYVADSTAPSFFAGNVGIGTSTPIADAKLQVIGNVYANNSLLTSDAKFKQDLLPISSPLNKILSLNGHSYQWKTDEYKEWNFSAGRHYGVIAQEIEKVLPELVTTAEDGTKAVAYAGIIPVLIEAVKEQQKMIEKQQMEIAEIKKLLQKL